MEDRREFTASIEEGPKGGAFVEMPFSVEDVYGTKGRVAVRATFDGEEYRGSIAPMGGRHLLGVLKGIREKLGKGPGDSVRVTVERDLAERTVDMPEELARALAQDGEAARIFEGLSYTRRKEFARWVGTAKKSETRVRRAERAPAMIREGRAP